MTYVIEVVSIYMGFLELALTSYKCYCYFTYIVYFRNKIILIPILILNIASACDMIQVVLLPHSTGSRLHIKLCHDSPCQFAMC